MIFSGVIGTSSIRTPTASYTAFATAGMILMALVPPLWRRVMDPRMIGHYGGDPTRANIHPRARGRVLARYGPAG